MKNTWAETHMEEETFQKERILSLIFEAKSYEHL